MSTKPFLDVSKFDTGFEHSSRKDDCLVNCPDLHPEVKGGKAEIHPKEIYFGDTMVNTQSAFHTISVKNVGDGPLVITDVVTVGDFTGAIIENPPITIGVGGVIEVLVYFRPRETGSRTGGIYFNTGDAAGDEMVELFGSGLEDTTDPTDPTDPEDPDDPTKVVSLSPSALSFGNVDVGSTSGGKNITLKNATAKAIAISGITATGDFLQSNNCGDTLSPGSSCVISLRFKPAAMGARTGSLTVGYDSSKTKSSSLSGQGTDPSSVLPTLSISDGTIVSGESSVALRAYPDGATELTKLQLPSVIEGNETYFDLMIKAVGTGSVALTELPATAGQFTIQYSDDHTTWEPMTSKTLANGEILHARVTAAASLTTGDYVAVMSFKVNGLAKSVNVAATITESVQVTKRIRIAGNQFYQATSLADTGGTLPEAGAFRLKSVNWFGNESANYTFHGIWARRWTDIIDQIAGMGFNCIRLPFCGEIVQLNTSPPTTAFDADLNPEFVGKTSLQIVDLVVDYCATKGIYIVLDHHRGKAGTGTIGNPVDGDYTLAKWYDTWAKLASRYGNRPNIVGADVHNEPHDLDWDTWVTYTQNCAAAIHAVSTDWIIFCQGVASYNNVSYWWGGQLAGVKDKPVQLGIANRIAYSPHEYGQSVGTQNWLAYDGQTPPANWPNNLASVWDAAWGFIYYDKIAPLWIGEFGGHFGVDGSGNVTKPHATYEKQWLAQLVKYMNFDKNLDGTVSNTERPSNQWQGISFAYWCYNPNSGDTGGLVQDDWTTPQTVKLNLLTNLLN